MLPLPNPEDEPLSPIARCYQIAAARGRALRLAREKAEAQAVNDRTDAGDEAVKACGTGNNEAQ